MLAGAAFTVKVTKTPNAPDITVYLQLSPATLGGTSSAATSTGVVDFFYLTISAAGTQTLKASAKASGTPSVQVSVSAYKLVFTTQPVNVSATQTAAGTTMASVAVTLQDGSSTTVSSFAQTVSLQVSGNGSALSGTRTVALASGVATFSSLKINKAGTFQLEALGVESAVTTLSASFTISAVAAKIKFTTSPSNSLSGQTFTCDVKVYDVNEDVMSGYSSAVTVSLSSATLSGTTTINAVNGEVSFTGLSVSAAGTYQLLATSGSLSALSSPFTVGSQVVVQSVGSVAAGIAFSVTCYLQKADGTKDTVAQTMQLTGPGSMVVPSATTNTLNGSNNYVFAKVALGTSGSHSLTVKCTSCTPNVSASITVTAAYTATVSVSMQVNYMPKGLSTFTYQVKASEEPGADFTLALTASSAAVSVSPASLTFTSANYSTAQTVTVTANSAYANPTTIYTATITHAATSAMTSHTSPNLLFAACDPDYMSANVLSLTIFEQKTATVILFSGSPVFSAGGSGTYTVVLGSQPSSDVVITPNQSPSLVISPSSLTFTNANWSTPQTFTASSGVTAMGSSSSPILVTHSVSGDATVVSSHLFVPSTVKILVLRNSLTAVLLSGDFAFSEGREGSYGIVLSSQPTSTVTVTLALSNAYMTLATSSFTFTPLNFDSPQIVTITTVSGSASASMSYSTVITHTVASSDANYNGSATVPSSVQATAVNFCSLGFYSYPPGAGVCAPCAQGYSCLTVYANPVACGATTYSPYGEWRCLPCPAGYACSGSGLPTPCSPGTQSAAGAGVCAACAAGTPCGIPDGSDTQACEAGSYALPGDRLCKVCPVGYSCAASATAPTECSTGKYANAGASSCSSSPAAFFAYDPFASPRPCSVGYYAAATSDHCTACPAGSSCSQSGTVTACSGKYALAGWGVCTACTRGSCSTLTTETLCPVNQYLSGGACTACPAGKVCNGVLQVDAPPGRISAGSDASSACSLGTFASFGKSTCTSAVAGKFSDHPSLGEQLCPPVTYTTTTGNFVCPYCDPGSTCSTGVLVACTAGFYCHPSTLVQQVVDTASPCPGGTTTTGTGNKDSTVCTLCPVGKSCEQANTTPVNCVGGHFCLVGSKFTAQYWCPAGTYSSSTSATSGATCLACSAGKFCPQSSTAEVTCRAGGYCPASSRETIPCPIGTFSAATGNDDAATDCTTCQAGGTCAQGSLFTLKCPLGSFKIGTGGKTIFNDCTLCTAGTSCSSLGLTAAPATACGQGSVCKAGTHFPDEFPCPAGTDKDVTTSVDYSATSCAACAAGYFCSQATSGTLQKKVRCPRGTVCASTGTTYSYESPCAAGTYSYSLGSSGTCTNCLQGEYCPRGAFVSAGKCAPGFYCPTGTARDDQNACAAGKYSAKQNLNDPSQCTDCPAGYFCYAGTSVPRPCPPGTVATATGSTAPAGCTACTAGNKCPQGSSAQVSCGAGYYTLASASTCEDCPAGAYCVGAVPVKSGCPAGKLCPLRTNVDPTSNVNYDCPAGYYCPAATSAALPCPPGKKRTTAGASASGDCVDSSNGYYTVVGASTDTGRCEPGFYCPAGSTGPYAMPCPANTFMLEPGAYQSSQCLNCPAGKYCPLGTTVPIVCPAGFYCVANSKEPTACPIGTLGATIGLKASSECTLCPVGYYCSQPGLIVPDGTCAPGVICEAGSKSSSGKTSGGSVCSAGGYCEPGLGIKRDCPSGTYNPDTGAKDQSYCKPCTESYYCTGSEVTPTLECPAGYYCPTGTNFQKANPSTPGFYSPTKSAASSQCVQTKFANEYAQAACTDCLAGFYCPKPGITQPTICPTGNYCPASASGTTPCDIGTFNMVKAKWASSHCQTCTAGKYCSVGGLSLYEGDCDAGFWCLSGAPLKNPETTAATYGPCPVGYYCLAGTAEAAPCPSGTIRTTTLGTTLASCSNCPMGYYCTSTGRSTSEGKCATGFYCPAGERISRPHDRSAAPADIRHCAAGQYCPLGSSIATNCDPGTYQLNAFQDACNTCPQGYVCSGNTGNYAIPANECGTGYYCVAGTKTATSYSCSAGKYNPLTKRSSASECITCDPGKYCQSPHSSAPDGDCDPGYFCKTSSTVKNPSTPDPGDSTGGMCIAGTYCPAGSSSPLQCKGGKYCNTSAMSAVAGDCDAGYYCIIGSSSKTPSDGIHGNSCPQGYYCTAGTVSPIPCPIGKYSSSAGQTSSATCADCPQGYYCRGVAQLAQTNQCTAGYYCVAGTSEEFPQSGRCTAGNMCPAVSHAETPCPAGEYQDLPLQSACKACPGGFFCDGTNRVTPTTCPAGKYCPSGSSAAVACPASTYNELTGTDSVTACIQCPPGQYCTGGGSAPNGQCQAGYYCKGGASAAAPTKDTQGSKCKKGFYCPAGSTQQILCTPGKYCDTDTLSTFVGSCQAGYYCIEGAQSANPMDGITGDVCPAGYYCPAGSAAPTPCSPGSYNSSPGKTVSSDCITCPAGFYCGSLAATATTGKCQAGYYCPAGQKTASPSAYVCTAGNYCPSGSTSLTPCPTGTFNKQIGQAVCQNCPKGHTCAGSSSLPVQCTAGYMCPGGNSVATMIACENGYFQPFPGQANCVSCPAGFYCGAGPLTSPTLCPAASYCPSGIDTPYKCPAGTYTTKTGLQQSTQCTYCPAGKYCTLGIVQGDCSAGFYCESGSNLATPDGYSNTGKAYPCPIGYYCPAGTPLPIPCPAGRFRMITGGAVVGDCTLCQAGYYCILNDPVPKICPLGSYCPEGSSQPTPCPPGTYNSQYLGTGSDTCLQCPAGTLCSNYGIGLSSNYPCVPGSYCPAGAIVPVISPRSKFSPGSSAGSVSDLVQCPGGFYCLEGYIGYTACQAWTYCGAGSYQETLCPGGSFCGNVTVTPSPCPAGWYCPRNSTTVVEFPPSKCPPGAVCPAGSEFPTYCRPGEIAIKSYGVIAPRTECKACGPGTYGDTNHTACLDCSAGYVCLGNTTTSTPTDREVHKGYMCSPGYYSDTGAFSDTPCPAGTYSVSYGGNSRTSCMDCPEQTYNEVEGMSMCRVCGLWANSTADKTNCQCRGSNRVFLKTDRSCPCKANYEYIDISGNSHTDSGLQDCVQKVFTRCPDGQLRDEMGKCTSDTNCNDECKGAGKRTPGLGICQCEQVVDVDTVCNTQCRRDVPKAKLTADGNLTITDPLNSTVHISVALTDIPGLMGKNECYQNQSCSVRFMDTTGDQPKGLYAPPAGIYKRNTTKRTLQDTATDGIPNPVICINLGETMIFAISPPSHYPVFRKDSLLNTNPDFDYSQFALLQSRMKAGWTNITYFAFTFSQPGIMLFADALDTSQQTVISVMSDNTSCPDSDKYVQPRTAASLKLLGAKLDEEIVLGVNWSMVYGLIFSLFISILIFTLLFYYYSRLAWKLPARRVVPYREMNKKLLIEGDEHVRSRLQLYVEVDSDKSTEEEELARLLFSRPPNVAQDDDGTYVSPNEDVDPAILQGILARIKEANKSLLEQLQAAATRAQDDLTAIMQKADDIASFLGEKVEPFLTYAGRGFFDSAEEPPELDPNAAMPEIPFPMSPPQEAAVELDEETEALKRTALKELAVNAEALEQDKQKLMDELSAEFSKMQDSMNQYRDRSENDLKRRLAERTQRRQALLAQKRGLEQELQTQKQQLEALGRKQAMQQAQEEVQIDQEIQLENYEERCELVGPHSQSELQALKDRCAASPDQAAEMILAFERDMQRLEENLSMNQIKEKAAIQKRTEERRAKRQRDAAAARVKREQAEREATQARSLELQKRLEEVALGETLAMAMPMLEVRDTESRSGLEHEKTLDESIDSREASTLGHRRDAEHEVKQHELEVARNQLRERIDGASDAERAELLQQLEAVQRQLDDNEKRYMLLKKAELENRLEERRKFRQERMKERRQRQEKEHKAAEQRRKADDEKKRTLALEQALQLARDSVPPHLYQDIVKALLEEKNEREVASLRQKQAREQRLAQSSLIEEHFRRKANDLQLIRREFKGRKAAIDKSDPDYEVKVEAIGRAEKEVVAGLDFTCAKDLEEALDRTWKDLRRRQAAELSDLIDRQIQEARRIQSTESNKAGLEEIERQLAVRKTQMEQEQQRKVEMMEQRKGELNKQRLQKQQELEDLIRREREDEERKDSMRKELLKKRELEEKRRRFEDELRRRNISEDKMEQMLEDYQRGIAQAEKMQEQERLKQSSVMSQKLAERRRKKQEIQESLDRIREEQDRWQKKLDSMPGLAKPEANKLLRRWRRYPRKAIKEVAASLSRPGGSRDLPQPLASAVVEADSRMRELLQRVERVEKIAKNIDSQQFAHMQKTLAALKDKLK